MTAGILRNSVQIVAELRRMRITCRSDFFNDWILLHFAPISSSGVQMIGHEYPAWSQVKEIDERISALAICVQFQVIRYSTP